MERRAWSRVLGFGQAPLTCRGNLPLHLLVFAVALALGVGVARAQRYTQGPHPALDHIPVEIIFGVAVSTLHLDDLKESVLRFEHAGDGVWVHWKTKPRERATSVTFVNRRTDESLDVVDAGRAVATPLDLLRDARSRGWIEQGGRSGRGYQARQAPVGRGGGDRHRERSAIEAAPTMEALLEAMDRAAVGQESAKVGLATALLQHRMRIDAIERGAMPAMQKQNVLVLGPTGSGKTLLVDAGARKIGVPVAKADATALSEEGYQGRSATDIVSDLLLQAGGDVKLAQRGVVFIDEVDKIAADDTEGRDVSGKGVQQGLLAMIQGQPVTVELSGQPPSAHHEVAVDTSNVLFLAAGAFPELAEIISRRERDAAETARIGFTGQLRPRRAEPGARVAGLTETDLEAYGLLSEFIGRLPFVVKLASLTREQLREILVRPGGVLERQISGLAELGITLEVTRSAVGQLVESAVQRGTNARGLDAALIAAIEPARARLYPTDKSGKRRALSHRRVHLGVRGGKLHAAAGLRR